MHLICRIRTDAILIRLSTYPFHSTPGEMASPSWSYSDREWHINLRNLSARVSRQLPPSLINELPFFLSVVRRRIYFALFFSSAVDEGCRTNICVVSNGIERRKNTFSFLSMCRIIYLEERKRERATKEAVCFGLFVVERKRKSSQVFSLVNFLSRRTTMI